MDSFLSCYDEYVNALLSSQSLSLLTSNTEIVVPFDSIVNVLNESLYNNIISSLPISLSVFEEISTNTKRNNSNGIFIKGRIREKLNDIELEIELQIHDKKSSLSTSSTTMITTKSSIFDIYHLPSPLVPLPNVGSYYFISKKNSEDEILLHCL